MQSHTANNLLDYFIYFYHHEWNGTEESTSSFLKILESLKNDKNIDQDEFVRNVIRLKTYINGEKIHHPSVDRTIPIISLPGITYNKHTEQFKKLNDGLDRFLPNFSDMIQYIMPEFIATHRIESSTLVFIVLLMILIPLVQANPVPANQNECKLDSSRTCADSSTALIQIDQQNGALFRMFTLPPIESDLTLMRQEIQQIKIIQLQNIKDGTMTAPSHNNLKRIQNALEEIGNLPILKVLQENKVEIVIVPEEYMSSLVKIPDFSACFVTTPYNSILLNEHIFKNWDNQAKNQLTVQLANELSHAGLHNSKPLEQRKASETGYESLVPWSNDAEKKLYMNAYDHFIKRVNRYEYLLNEKKSKGTLSKRDQYALDQFDNAILSYIPPLYGATRHTGLQEKTSLSLDNSLVVEKNVYDTEPPASQQEQHLDYLRRAFFQEMQNKKNLNKLLYKNNIGIYIDQYSSGSGVADQLSDFESMSPKMREVFGKKLCSYLTEVTFKNIYPKESDNHCQRPGWPKKS